MEATSGRWAAASTNARRTVSIILIKVVGDGPPADVSAAPEAGSGVLRQPGARQHSLQDKEIDGAAGSRRLD